MGNWKKIHSIKFFNHLKDGTRIRFSDRDTRERHFHKLTENIYEEMQEGNDTIAEHIRSLDIATPKTVEDLMYSNLPALPMESCFNQEALILQLATNHNLLAQKFEELIQMSEEAGDQLTVDLGVERGRVHKKNQWLLKSNLDYKK